MRHRLRVSGCRTDQRTLVNKMLRATKANTSSLLDILRLSSQQLRIEQLSHSRKSGLLGSSKQSIALDDIARYRAHETRRLVSLVKMQYRELCSLKTEIDSLRRKRRTLS
mmetsp:Transcript_22043/g.68945  ORF Transcript_22043/g.68945 Transcript_22043/m.68945 type:complete len:110 (+) Transcript_22043:4909-5238(+)